MGRPSNDDRIRGLCEVFGIDLDQPVPLTAGLRKVMPDDEIAESALVQYLRAVGSAAQYELLDADDPVTAKRDLDWFRKRHGLD